jgi:DNA repair protein RadC
MTRREKKVSEPSTYHRKITDWPEAERPREKMLLRGVEALSDAELLAIILRAGTGKITAVDLAKTLLKDYDSLQHLCTRSVQELRKYKGLGNIKALTLVAVFEIGRRISQPSDVKESINSPTDVVKKMQPVMRDLKVELFIVFLLDSANHLLRIVKITEGLLNSSLVHPREVFKPAIAEPAASVILVHNHPSGNPEPSADDIQITRQIAEAGKVIGIPVHDHIIIAVDKYASFAEKGLL